MPISPELSLSPEQQEILHYGCKIADFELSVRENTFGFKWNDRDKWLDVAMSVLSDAQEEARRGRRLEAQQTINRAKWILRTYCEDK